MSDTYKVLIVEDEPFIRRSLERLIDWAGLRCEVAAAVGSGEEALRKLRSGEVNILLTDIRMNGMDGLELAEEVRARLPSVRIIFLTGHSEFAYAQGAVKLHAEDFILKPTDPAELRRSVLRAIDAIQSERDREQTLRSLRETVSRSFGSLREKLIVDLVHGHIPADEQLLERVAFLQLPPQEFVLVLMEVEEPESPRTPREELHRQMLLAALRQRSLEPAEGHAAVLVAQIAPNQLLMLAQKTTEEALEAIQEHIARLFDGSISMGISKPLSDWRGFRRGFEQAAEALRHRFYLGTGSIVRHADLGESGAVASDLRPLLDTGKLVEYVRAGDTAMARRELELVGEALSTGTDRGIIRARSAALEIYVLAQRAVAEYGLAQGPAVDQFLESISGCQTLAELLDHLTRIVTEAANAIHGRIRTSGRKTVDRVVRYIADHYQQTVGLEDLAREVCKHPKYLCRLIKRESGTTFSELLSSVRMDKALELLRDPVNNVAEVAYRIGMDDPHYFSKVFKRRYGTTPSEYRKQFAAGK